MGPYWASLPAQGTLFTKETFSRDSLDLLQDASMVQHCAQTIVHVITQPNLSAEAPLSHFLCQGGPHHCPPQPEVVHR